VEMVTVWSVNAEICGENDADVLVGRAVVNASGGIDVGARDKRHFVANGDVSLLVIAGEDVWTGQHVQLVLLGQGLQPDADVLLKQADNHSARGCHGFGGRCGAQSAGQRA
jgi:hypothetical protein